MERDFRGIRSNSNDSRVPRAATCERARRHGLSTATAVRRLAAARPMGAALADAIAEGQSRLVVSFAVCVVGKRVVWPVGSCVKFFYLFISGYLVFYTQRQRECTPQDNVSATTPSDSRGGPRKSL